MRFDRARDVADAVLFEGYALYPYRPTATKNQLRWQFGVLAPRVVSEATGSDPWWMETQCLLAATPAARVEGKLRFLRVRRRRVEQPSGEAVARLELDGALLVPWDEGELCEIDVGYAVDGGDELSIPVELDGDETEDTIRDARGAEVARVRRTRAPLSLRIAVASERCPASELTRLRIRVENVGACAEPRRRRDETLPFATLGTHLILAIDGGEFVSLLDPPDGASAAAASCRNVGTYPVLAGEPGRRDLLLSSPIILYDHPRVAPESPGNLFDATEIDEILTLRTLTLTDEEKRLARATDRHVAALIDRVENLPSAAWERLHGTFRQERPSSLVIAGAEVRRGSRVRLRPGSRRTDAQDMFLDGRSATVREIEQDVDGRDCVAVTVDDDPAAELHLWHGRYHYFAADEIEPLT